MPKHPRINKEYASTAPRTHSPLEAPQFAPMAIGLPMPSSSKSANRCCGNCSCATTPTPRSSSVSNNSSNNSITNHNIYTNHGIATLHLVRQRLARGRPELLMAWRQDSPVGLISAAHWSQHDIARARSLPGGPRSSRASCPKFNFCEGLSRTNMPTNISGRGGNGSSGVGAIAGGGRRIPPDGRRSADFMDEGRGSGAGHESPPSFFSSSSSGNMAAGGRSAWTSPTSGYRVVGLVF